MSTDSDPLASSAADLTTLPAPGEIRDDSLLLAKYCARVLDARRMDDIVVFDVSESLQITDYFILASGRNSRQIKGVCDLIDKKLTDVVLVRYGLEGYQEGIWVLLDFDVVIIHLFLEGQRRLYDLDLHWGDSPRIEWKSVPSAS